MEIKGVLIAIGGNEDKGIKRKQLHVPEGEHSFFTSGILYRVVSEMKDPALPIEVITTASSIPQTTSRNYARAFQKLGCKNVQFLHPETKEEADAPEILDRISKAACLMFSGGDQFKLASIFKGTQCAKIINERYKNDYFIIAGTSAGAMAMPDLMIYPAVSGESREVLLYEGLSLIHEVLIDTHFLVRGRFRRLAMAVANEPQYLGIGLEEDTGIIIRGGNRIETIGSGLVTIIDGRKIQESNTTVHHSEHDIFIENLLVHVLSHGNNFTLRNKKIS
mgnify:CR=1 FL=1